MKLWALHWQFNIHWLKCGAYIIWWLGVWAPKLWETSNGLFVGTHACYVFSTWDRVCLCHSILLDWKVALRTALHDYHTEWFVIQVMAWITKQKFTIRVIGRLTDKLRKSSFFKMFAIQIPNVFWIQQQNNELIVQPWRLGGRASA